jgi:hypothetical protein
MLSARPCASLARFPTRCTCRVAPDLWISATHGSNTRRALAADCRMAVRRLTLVGGVLPQPDVVTCMTAWLPNSVPGRQTRLGNPRGNPVVHFGFDPPYGPQAYWDLPREDALATEPSLVDLLTLLCHFPCFESPKKGWAREPCDCEKLLIRTDAAGTPTDIGKKSLHEVSHHLSRVSFGRDITESRPSECRRRPQIGVEAGPGSTGYPSMILAPCDWAYCTAAFQKAQ